MDITTPIRKAVATVGSHTGMRRWLSTVSDNLPAAQVFCLQGQL